MATETVAMAVVTVVGSDNPIRIASH
jgi:membrane-bound ClpP family serine protease